MTPRCPAPLLCDLHRFIPYCVKCNHPPSKPVSSIATQFEVITNVTEAMSQGHFWTYTNFHNHSGIDEVLTQERWDWNPKGNILNHDVMGFRRTTEDETSDLDSYATESHCYSVFNTTHILHKALTLIRQSYDTGTNFMDVTNDDIYLERL